MQETFARPLDNREGQLSALFPLAHSFCCLPLQASGSLRRLHFDVTFQLPEYPHILLTEQIYDQGLRQLQEAGYLDRKIEIADDGCCAFFWLQRVTNMDVNVGGRRAFLQQHGVMETDALWRIILGTGARPLACRSRVEIGGAETDRIW